MVRALQASSWQALGGGLSTFVAAANSKAHYRAGARAKGQGFRQASTGSLSEGKLLMKHHWGLLMEIQEPACLPVRSAAPGWWR